MAGASSTDLRSRVLAAAEAGEMPDAAARRFAVGRSTAYPWVVAARHEGRRAAKPMANRWAAAPSRSLPARSRRRGMRETDNHQRLAECRDLLAEATGVRVHLWTVGRAMPWAGRCGA